jgi:hypothetical protein
MKLHRGANVKVRSFLRRLEVALCIASGAICAVLHVATFITTVPMTALLLPFALLVAAVLSAQAASAGRHFKTRNWKLLGYVLFIYSVVMIVYDYRTTGGSSGVEMVGGNTFQPIGTVTRSEPSRNASTGCFRIYGLA